MKSFFIAIIFLVILGVAGYFGFKYFVQGKSSETTQYKSTPVSLAGVLKSTKGDDYSHALLSGGKLTGVASYSVNLDDYVGQKVEVTGQYSGTTLYADSVTKVD